VRGLVCRAAGQELVGWISWRLSAPRSRRRWIMRGCGVELFCRGAGRALPERDPQETVFRLLLAVLDQTTWSSRGCADLFFSVDDAADGPVAGHWPLHGLRTGLEAGRPASTQAAMAVLRPPSERKCECTFGGFLAIGAANAAAPAAAFTANPGRAGAAGPAPLHLASPGAAFGAQLKSAEALDVVPSGRWRRLTRCRLFLRG